VATLSGQSDSILNLYRALIGLRNGAAALNSGRVEGVASNGGLLRYERVDDGQRLTILLNFNQSQEEAPIGAGRIVASTYMDRSDAVELRVSLRPFEGVVIRND
jgi:alpha-glucosidase